MGSLQWPLSEYFLLAVAPTASICGYPKGSYGADLLNLAGPARETTTDSRLLNVVADSARRWLSATDHDLMDGDTSDEDMPDEERLLM